MCQFFSFVGDGFGNYLYSDDTIRKANKGEQHDSHTWILTHHGTAAGVQDRWSKYEYNPLTKAFNIDEPVEYHDHEAAENWVHALKFKTVIPELIIKPIVNPLSRMHGEVIESDIQLLKQWASVWASVWARVWDSVGPSVGASVRAGVWDSVRGSVWDSVWDSVRGSVWDSVRASVRDRVWASVRASVWAYFSSFFDIKYNYDFSPCVKLYKRHLVPSFDGTIWRLHSGKDAKIVWEGQL
jgi:hypothetical protein